MPVKTSEDFIKERQEKYEAIKKDIDEIRTKLLKEKDLPLDKRTEISYNVPIEFLCTYPGLERQYSEGYIKNLAKDISKIGIIHKPVCTLNFNSNLPLMPNEPNLYINAFIYVVCGNGRINALKELAKSSVDILIKYMTSNEAFDMSQSENDNKDELNPIDRASQFKNWMNTTNITQSQIADKRNKTQPWVSMHLKLLTFPDEIQKLIRIKKVSLNQANKLFQIDDKDAQIKLAELCAEGLSEKELDDKIQQLKLKAITINAFIPPEGTEQLPEQQLSLIDDSINKTFVTPNKSQPVSPVPPKPQESQLSPAETVIHYLNDVINKAYNSITNKEDVELLFKCKLQALSIFNEPNYDGKRCDGKCNSCEHQDKCKKLVKFSGEYGVNFPDIA